MMGRLSFCHTRRRISRSVVAFDSLHFVALGVGVVQRCNERLAWARFNILLLLLRELSVQNMALIEGGERPGQ